MKNKPDDRSDNVDRIQHNISNTIENIRLADEMIEKTDDEKARQGLQAKNERREEALNGMRHEIKDEAINSKVNSNHKTYKKIDRKFWDISD